VSSPISILILKIEGKRERTGANEKTGILTSPAKTQLKTPKSRSVPRTTYPSTKAESQHPVLQELIPALPQTRPLR
jgi:hypothetical protein